ncbi:hypothetical protein [Erythrobacter litoralis]|uniref:Metallo-beta-lactamase family protein n=1 Tax=Erythrobacter litoralis (strain HTCC2594) TaxID=314225 RepID=Q2NBU3_ERYLH|nr:hypothetical protein [Erythrobacter litoralis]ABC62848.1 metallo-beta-lactamase family protein [Erythrobacter litoralis HTCC2594]
MAKKIALGLLALILLIVGATLLFQRQIGQAVFERAAEARVAGNGLTFDDGLHLVLCGTGSPLPNPDRAGPCQVIVAGDQAWVVDIGEGGHYGRGAWHDPDPDAAVHPARYLVGDAASGGAMSGDGIQTGSRQHEGKVRSLGMGWRAD